MTKLCIYIPLKLLNLGGVSKFWNDDPSSISTFLGRNLGWSLKSLFVQPNVDPKIGIFIVEREPIIW